MQKLASAAISSAIGGGGAGGAGVGGAGVNPSGGINSSNPGGGTSAQEIKKSNAK